jgi:hypothetical protein
MGRIKLLTLNLTLPIICECLHMPMPMPHRACLRLDSYRSGELPIAYGNGYPYRPLAPALSASINASACCFAEPIINLLYQNQVTLTLLWVELSYLFNSYLIVPFTIVRVLFVPFIS